MIIKTKKWRGIMKKRILSLLLASFVLVSLVGCSSGGNKTKEGNTTGNGINFKEEPYTLSVTYPVYGVTPNDLPKVQAKVNEITLKNINTKVEFKPVSVTNMSNAYALAASSGEKQDLIMMIPGNMYLTGYAANKMIMPIDDVLDKYGKDIKAGLGNILETAKVDGKTYGIPSKMSDFAGNGVWMLDSIVKKYNIDITKIKTLDDLDPIFEKVHAGEPNLQIFMPIGISYYFNKFDTLGNSFGVLRNGGLDDLKVVNEFETQEWINNVKKVREWYEKGYISKDFATTDTSPDALQNANKVFAIPMTTSFDNRRLVENPPKDSVTLFNPVKKTELFQTFIWAVPTNAQKPDKSIQFLNLVFQDQALANLIEFGIEGEHYVTNKDGSIDRTIGAKTYNMVWGLWGNTDKYPIEQSKLSMVGGDLAKYKTVKDQWDKDIKTSKAFGFIFKPDSVKTEIASCNAVFDQYMKLLEGGALDPDKNIKAFNDKLYAAGLQKIMDEKQRQLDEWAKTQK
jgi:putative aldouronate transport system substrate-binding protein